MRVEQDMDIVHHRVVRAQVFNKSPITVTGISASLLQHCTYTGANGTRRIRDSRVYASANDIVSITKHSKVNRSPRFVDSR